MLRDATFTETSRCEAVDEAGADFVMDEETFRAFYDRTARGRKLAELLGAAPAEVKR
jgi:hypothetical protein